MAGPLALVEQHYRNVSSAAIDAEDELFSPDVETIDPGAGTWREPAYQSPPQPGFFGPFEITGNRITRNRIYYDQVQFMSQLGLVQ